MNRSPDAPSRSTPSPGAGSAPGDSALPGLPTRALQVFVAPGELFRRLRERPVWLDAMLLVIALSAAYALLLPQELLREAMIQQAPEGADVEQMERFAGWTRWIGAVLGPLIGAAVVAGVTHLVFTLILGGRSTYRQLFSATAHMFLVPTVGTLLTLPLIISTGDLQTTLGLHLLVPGIDTGTFAFRFLRGLNVFGLAGAAVMGVAVGELYDDRSTRSGISVMLVLYVIFVALGALLGGLGAAGAA